MFVSVRNYGIFSIQKSDYAVDYRLKIPKVASLDLIVNPILETKYIGVLVNQESNEFFVEINVDKEDSPLVNRIFVHNKKLKNIFACSDCGLLKSFVLIFCSRN